MILTYWNEAVFSFSSLLCILTAFNRWSAVMCRRENGWYSVHLSPTLMLVDGCCNGIFIYQIALLEKKKKKKLMWSGGSFRDKFGSRVEVQLDTWAKVSLLESLILCYMYMSTVYDFHHVDCVDPSLQIPFSPLCSDSTRTSISQSCVHGLSSRTLFILYDLMWLEGCNWSEP